MMLSKNVLGILLLACMAGAQNPPQTAKATPASRPAPVAVSSKPAPAATKTAAPLAVKPGVAATKPVSGAVAQKNAAAQKAAAVQKKEAAALPNAGQTRRKGAAAKPAREEGQPEVVATAAGKRIVGQGHRDPFTSIIQSRNAGGPNCSSGKKCLIPNQVLLKGVVKSQNGMLAVVENGQGKSYFLRENDPVFNGQVLRITADSIVFREKVLDRLGREMSREVIKRVPGSRPAA